MASNIVVTIKSCDEMEPRKADLALDITHSVQNLINILSSLIENED
jgi:hypothetical protein